MSFFGIAILFFSLWIDAVVSPAHAGNVDFCASLLAIPVENSGAVESAFSEAWIDLLQQALAVDEGRLRSWAWSVLEVSGRTPIVSRDSWIPPAELLPAGAGEGFEEFREAWDAMALAGREVDSSRFSWRAREALSRLLGETEAAAGSRGAAEVRRSRTLEPIRRVRLPSRTTGITLRVLRTRDSTLVVGSYAKEVVFMDMEGVVLNQVAIDGFYQTPLIQLRDGRIPVQVRSGELHFFSARGDALPGAIDTGSRIGLGAVTELSDGTRVGGRLLHRVRRRSRFRGSIPLSCRMEPLSLTTMTRQARGWCS